MIMSEKIYISDKKYLEFLPSLWTRLLYKIRWKNNTSKVSNDLLKNNCESEGLGKFKMIINCECV